MADATTGLVSGASSGASAGAMLGPYGALAGGVIGGVWGLASGLGAAKARQKAQEEARRRAQAASDQVQGTGEAAAGASGLEMTGGSSMAQHLDLMAQEFRKNQELAMKQAALGKSLADKTSTVNFMSTLGSSLFNFAQSKNWWQQPKQEG